MTGQSGTTEKRQFFALVKSQLISQFSGKSGNIKKWAVLLIVFLGFLPIFASMAVSVYYLGIVAAEGAALAEVFSLILTSAQMAVMFFGLFTLISTVYFSTDNEILLALPIKSRTIFLSKLSVVYLNELFLSCVLGLVMFVPLGIGAGAGVLYFLFVPVIIMILPILPLLIATLVSVPLMFLVSFFKRRGALASLVVMLLFATILGLTFAFSSSSAVELETNFTNISEVLKAVLPIISQIGKSIYPNFVLGLAAFAGSFGEFATNFLIGIGIIAVLLFAAVVVANFCYGRSISVLESPKSGGGSELEFKQDRNIAFTLMKKDFLEIIKDPSMAVQCVLPAIIMPILIISMIVGLKPVLSEVEAAERALLKVFMPIAIMLVEVVMVISINITSASAITRENKNFYLLKVMPVKYETQVKAKAQLGSLINAATMILSNFLAMIILGLNMFYVILATVFLIVLGAAFSINAVGLDLKKPRLNWQTPMEGIKNNSASLFGLLYSVIAFLLLAIICGAFILWYFAANSEFVMLLMWLVLIFIAFVTHHFMQKKLFKNIEQKFDAVEG